MKNTGNKKPAVKEANINSFLALGIVLVAIGAILGAVVPGIPSVIPTILYIVGILALILYMWEIQYRRRTGDYRDEGAPKSGKKRK